MKYRNSFLLFIIGFILQSTMTVYLNMLSITPNLILCLVILFSFLYGGNRGLVLGVIFGLIQDLNFSLVIGPAAIMYLLIALLMSEIRNYLYRDSVLNLFFASVLGTGIYYLGCWGIATLFGGIYSFIYVMERLPILLAYHFGIMLLYYITIGRKTIRHSQDRYYIGSNRYIKTMTIK